MEANNVTASRVKIFQIGLVVSIVALLAVVGLFYNTSQSQMGQINTLTLEKNNLNSQMANLTTQVSNLTVQLNDLKDKYSELSAIVNLTRKETLEKNRRINMTSSADVSLSYSTPYAGYLKTDFEMSAYVELHISSFFTGTEYVIYPLPGETEILYFPMTGTFSVPLFPGVTTLRLQNVFHTPVKVSLTITYVY